MIKRLLSSINLIFRVLKNLIQRPFRMLYTKIMNFFSAGKLVTKIPGATKKLPSILKSKPEKRQDYFDWGSFYIAKKLVLIIILILIIVPLLIIFVIVPLFTSWFGTKAFVVGDEGINTYSGRVIIYYDEQHESVYLEGRLQNGLVVELGEEFYESGRNKYVGSFDDGKYSGSGTLYYEDGSIQYKGEFQKGTYSGVGVYTDEQGKTYSGTFQNGVLQGRATVTDKDKPVYEGNFLDGEMTGEGKLYYSNGAVHFSGSFLGGVPDGNASEYYEGGQLKYGGTFTDGLYNGDGVLYTESGSKLYSGGFERGVYSGTGTKYSEHGVKLYSGEFENGLYSGSGMLYYSDGSVVSGTFAEGDIAGAAVRSFTNGMRYEGMFSDLMMHGKGTITDAVGSFSYTGDFRDDDISFGTLLNSDITAIKEMFGGKLTQNVSDDCFYLENKDFGITIKCSFARGDIPASIMEICAAPLISGSIEIKSVKDIIAPNALKISKTDKKLAAWVADKYALNAASTECYEATYEDCTVYYWVQDGRLAVKTAIAAGSGNSGGTGSGTANSGNEDYALTDEELIKLFESIGLDIEDFRSLGF